MSLLSRLREKQAVRFATATPATVATLEGDKGRTVASVATVSVATVPEAKTATASRWWQIHYPDREPVEVACFPPATLAEILERHPEAIAAEPIRLQRNHSEPARACSTCAHVTGRGGCGEPVAADLSGVAEVIVYSPDLGATCPAWLAIIPDDLEARILAMAERWNYSGDDLALVLEGARSDPAGWRKVVEADEKEGR